MDNVEMIDDGKRVEKVDLIEIEAERITEEFFEQLENLKQDRDFLKNCQIYNKMNKKDVEWFSIFFMTWNIVLIIMFNFYEN